MSTLSMMGLIKARLTSSLPQKLHLLQFLFTFLLRLLKPIIPDSGALGVLKPWVVDSRKVVEMIWPWLNGAGGIADVEGHKPALLILAGCIAESGKGA
jgi:hypothetical protein